MIMEINSKKEYKHKWYIKNKTRLLEKAKKNYSINKEKKSDYYKNTPMGRALYLVSSYKREDKKHNRGECDFDAKWIVENILFKPCAHCGKEGWKVIGCNRLDNTKPHTKDNVEPCCTECNWKEFGKIKAKKIYQYTLDNQLVRIWESVTECGRNGYERSNITACCNGKRKTHKGYRWSFEPL